jgi:hypothetical protein
VVADFRRLALSASLAIVATILVVMGSRAIFPQPKYPDCELFPRPIGVDKPEAAEEDPACRVQIEAYEARQGSVAKNQFFVLLAGSVGMIILGGFVYAVPVVSSGILWGGVLSLFFSLIASFREGIEDYFRLLAAAVAFIVLIALALRMFGKEARPPTKR